MKFNASTDPTLSEVELTESQIKCAKLLDVAVNNDTDAATDEIIALRAALESHAESLRKARLAAWEAGRKAAMAECDAIRTKHVELRKTACRGDREAKIEMDWLVEGATLSARAIRALPTPTPEALETMT